MFKLLSLDGGGSWAILQLLTLKEKYGDKTGHEILRDFDLVIANSGGSIALTALAENWSIDKALTLFDDKPTREKIFSKNSFKERFFPVDYLRLFGAAFGPKYSATRKGEAFKDLFPEVDKRQMNELPEFIGKPDLKIVVCTFDALNNRAKFFKSYTKPGNNYDSVRLTQAIHGSSNAPIQYFDFPARFKAKQSGIYYDLWDGALGGFNNPVLAGLIEAFKLDIPLEEIKIISIGTGNKLMSMEDKRKFWGEKQTTIEERKNKWHFRKLKPQLNFFMQTVLNQAKTILYQPPDWSNYVALMFLKKNKGDDLSSNFIRLSPMIHVDKNTNPDIAEELHQLYELDMDLVKNEDIDLLKRCFEYWKKGEIKNQPIEYNVTRENELIYKSGDKTFVQAMAKW